jgi:hypothetical protein
MIEIKEPKKITDIVYEMEDYLQIMREMDEDDMLNFVTSLENYIKIYFSDNEIDEVELKAISAEMIDEVYIKIMKLELKDAYVVGYFEIIIGRLFWEFTQKEIYVFFVVDNLIRDDRFKLLTELVAKIGFEVIYPYNITNSEYSENYTRQAIREYAEIENDITNAREQKKNIFYVEKDDSVNYLTNILQYCEDIQNEYLCVFRNGDSEEQERANLLMGSFGDMLE